MAGWNTADEGLPESHVFFTVSLGNRHRTFAVRRFTAAAGVCLAALLGLWSIGCTLYVAGHDSLLAAQSLHERDLQYDYEDRLAELQKQLDRSESQNQVSRRSVDAKVSELTTRQAELRTKAGTLARMTQQVLNLAARSAVQPLDSQHASAEPSLREDSRAVPALVEAREAVTKPHPEIPSDAPLHEESRADDAKTTDRLAALSAELGALSAAQDLNVANLTKAAQAQVSRYRQAVNEAGLSVSRFQPSRAEASGGPFVPLTNSSLSNQPSLNLSIMLTEGERLKAATAHIPFDKPLEGSPDVTSPFGPRIDPFLGRPGMHTGIDLREDTGTDVFATAQGRVTIAGPATGYGIMVELDHGEGLITRYGHLSATTVSPGQIVKAGEVIGRVGATGRATGPHLHYETRIDGDPVDPMRFLIAGHHLFGEQS